MTIKTSNPAFSQEISTQTYHSTTHIIQQNHFQIYYLITFLPTILIFTRVTYHATTLIDNIFVFQRKGKANQSIVSGNLYSDITVHLPNIAFLSYPIKMPPKPRSIIRVYNKLALLKKGDTFLCTNYRPISLLSCFHKLFEIFLQVSKATIIPRQQQYSIRASIRIQKDPLCQSHTY